MRVEVFAALLLMGCPPRADLPPDASTTPVTAPACLVPSPEVLDFGEIDAFTTAFGKVRLINLSPRTLQVRVTPLTAPWTIQQQEPTLRAGASLILDVQFLPTDGLLHFAELEVSGGDGCTTKVQLKGLGAGLVTVTPSVLDFGVVVPGERATRAVTFTNTRRVPVTLVGLGLIDAAPRDGGPPVFTVGTLGTMELAPLSSTSLVVTAQPPGEDFFTATLSAATAFGRLNVPVQVTGGAPTAQLTPETLDLPVVGFWPGSTPLSFADRVVQVRNLADAGGPFLADLRLVDPFFRIDALDGGAASELQVFPDSSLSFNGVPGQTTAELRLRLIPQSLGPRSFRLTLFTNDPRRSERVLTLDATAVSLPDCTLQVDPPLVARLTVTADGGSTGVVRFTNVGTNPCVLDDLRLPSGGDDDFSIASGGVNQVWLASGEAHVVTVAGPPPGPFTRSSVLLFHVFNRDADQRTIDLRVLP